MRKQKKQDSSSVHDISHLKKVLERKRYPLHFSGYFELFVPEKLIFLSVIFVDNKNSPRDSQSLNFSEKRCFGSLNFLFRAFKVKKTLIEE